MKSFNIGGKTSALVVFAAAILVFPALSGCKNKYEGRLLSSIDDQEVYADKTGRYKSMSFLTQSYLDYTILHITVLPVEKNGIQYGVTAPAINPALYKEHWGGSLSGDDLSWDTRWKTPKKFKVWWQKIFDEKKYSQSRLDDRYVIKEAEPGTAWCEAIVTIDKPLPLEPGYFILHFYPDGHVEAYISGLKELEAEKPRIKYEERMKLPVLHGKSCLKEIPNPYYGMPRPIKIN